MTARLQYVRGDSQGHTPPYLSPFYCTPAIGTIIGVIVFSLFPIRPTKNLSIEIQALVWLTVTKPVFSRQIELFVG